MDATKPTPLDGWTTPDLEAFISAAREIHSDVTRTAARMVSDRKLYEDQVERRSLVRAIGAYVEFAAHALRLVALRSHYAGQVEFGPHEVLALHERAFRLTDRGTCETYPQFPALVPGFLLALRSMYRATGQSFAGVTDGEGFKSFKAFAALRNRVTHPKSTHGAVVSGDELDSAISTVRWVDSLLNVATEHPGGAAAGPR